MVFATFVTVMLFLGAQPSPSPSAMPAPTTTATPAPSLDGITLGDDAASVFRRFEVDTSAPALPGDSIGDLQIRSFDSITDHGSITVYFDSRIRLVAVLSPGRGSAGGDGYGVAFGDSPQRVQLIRGTPDTVTSDGALIYEPDGRIQWVYEFQDGKLIMISVDDLHPR